MKKLITIVIAAVFAFSLFSPTPALAISKADNFFTGAVFLGDSITVGLSSYASKIRKTKSGFLSNAQFLAKTSYAVSHTLQSDSYSMHPTYNGTRQQPQKNLDLMKAKKVFIALGVNDAGGNETTLIANYKSLLKAIKTALPDVPIYIMPVFPMTKKKESATRSNAKIDSINVKLLNLATAEGVSYIDVNPKLKLDGALGKANSSDDYVHFNDNGYKIWTDVLYAFATFALTEVKDSGLAFGSTAKIIKVSSFVNAREKASSSSKLITTIPKGASVKILAKSGSWHKVGYDNKEVYVYSTYLGPESDSQGFSGTVVNVNNAANLRAGPGANYALAGSAKKGEILLTSKTYFNPDWYQVKFNNKTCYISKSLLKI